MLPTRTALSCLARSCCINAAVTARGMQQLGLLFALEPALRHLYPEAEARAQAAAHYSAHSNTHPYMLPFYMGLLLNIEEQVAEGKLPSNALDTVRRTLGTTLSAVGDGFFEGGVFPCWALCCICFLLAGHTLPVILLTVLLAVALLAFRTGTFFFALRYGLAALAWLKRLGLINWTGRIKVVNACLLTVAAAMLLPYSGDRHTLLWCMGGGAAVLGRRLDHRAPAFAAHRALADPADLSRAHGHGAGRPVKALAATAGKHPATPDGKGALRRACGRLRRQGRIRHGILAARPPMRCGGPSGTDRTGSPRATRENISWQKFRKHPKASSSPSRCIRVAGCTHGLLPVWRRRPRIFLRHPDPEQTTVPPMPKACWISSPSPSPQAAR